MAERPSGYEQANEFQVIQAVLELQNFTPFVRAIGDASKISTITNAVYWGHHAALDI